MKSQNQSKKLDQEEESLKKTNNVSIVTLLRDFNALKEHFHNYKDNIKK